MYNDIECSTIIMEREHAVSQLLKLYMKIKNNPKNVTFKQLDRLLRASGFVQRKKTVTRGKGSHFTYKHPDLNYTQGAVNIPRHKPIGKPYVLDALKKIEMVADFMEKD